MSNDVKKRYIHCLALTVRQMKIKFGKASFNTLIKIKIKIELAKLLEFQTWKLQHKNFMYFKHFIYGWN